LFKKLIVFGFIVSGVILSGCNEVTPKMISELLFKNIDNVYIFQNQNTKPLFLNDEEIDLIRKAIANGKELSELDSNDMPNDVPNANLNEYLCIILVKKSRSNIDLYYNYKEKYMLARKIHVHEEKVYIYEKQIYLTKKYLNGINKFYPSSEIERLITMVFKK
jgi:hypothetical protein